MACRPADPLRSSFCRVAGNDASKTILTAAYFSQRLHDVVSVTPRLQRFGVAVDALRRVGVDGGAAARRLGVEHGAALTGDVGQRRVDNGSRISSQRRLVLFTKCTLF